MNRPDGFSITGACEKTGVSPRTLRYYEQLGLLQRVRRRNSGRRVYGPDDIERLRFIQKLKQLGLSLQEISDLNAVYAIRGSTRAMLERLAELLRQHLEDVESKLHDLEELRSEMTSYLHRIAKRVDGLGGREQEKIRANGRS